jgi:hypothetical protein
LRPPPLDGGDPVLAREALQRDVALVAESEAALLDEALQVAGHEDLLGLREVRHPERVDHGLAEELVLVAQRLAAVEPDAQMDRLLGVPAAVGLERALEGYRAAHAGQR